MALSSTALSRSRTWKSLDSLPKSSRSSQLWQKPEWGFPALAVPEDMEPRKKNRLATLAKSAAKSRKPWTRRTDKYMKPFSLDVYISNQHIHAKVVHRVTSRVVALASTASRELKSNLFCSSSTTSMAACQAVGQLLARRCKEADVYAVVFTQRDEEEHQRRLETDKINAVLAVVSQNGITVVSASPT